jgi:hypothetical protein
MRRRSRSAAWSGDPAVGLAAVTKHIGLAGTSPAPIPSRSTWRAFFASLDHISRGRAAWNVVTSYLPDSGTISVRAACPTTTCATGARGSIWPSCVGCGTAWEDDAMVQDKASGVFLDKSKVHELNFRGEFYQCKGPINIVRPRAGSPGDLPGRRFEVGRTFAARHADGIFCVRCPSGNRASSAATSGRAPPHSAATRRRSDLPEHPCFCWPHPCRARRRNTGNALTSRHAGRPCTLVQVLRRVRFHPGHDVEAPFPEDVFPPADARPGRSCEKIERMVRAKGSRCGR